MHHEVETERPNGADLPPLPPLPPFPHIPKPDAEQIEKRSAGPGMLLECKHLYLDKTAEWEVWLEGNIELDAKATELSAQYALVVKREKLQEDDGCVGIKLHSVQVQSPLIKKCLSTVFTDYPGVNTNLKKLQFSHPFHEFFYRRREFLQASNDSKHDETVAEHFALIYDLVSAEIKPHAEEFEDLLQNGVIKYDLLWALFEPEIDLYSLVDGQHRLYRLKGSKYSTDDQGPKSFDLYCQYVDTDGTNFGYCNASLKIPFFADVLKISDLDVIPAKLKADMRDIETELVQRGKRFEQLKGCHYKAYSGDYLAINAYTGCMKRERLQSGRIMVDDAMYTQYTSSGIKNLQPLCSTKSDLSATFNDSQFPVEAGVSLNASAPVMYGHDMFGMPPPIPRMHQPPQGTLSPELSDQYYALCSPMVRGFCLTTKQWVSFYLDKIVEITWDEEAFERLVLPHDYKRLIQGLVSTQLEWKDEFDDVVSGKGQGIVMLLRGAPGLGKTLTAESVAEVMHKPLYSIGAGELGDVANVVESNLRRVLEISTKWNAVLLIDECDVFLEKRSMLDMLRGRLVAVFLRLLEYYQGVLFLTTNRIEAIDPAFDSRIHLTIEYPKLDPQARLHVWRTFVRSKDADAKYASNMTDDDLRQLANHDMNGRQIKNVVKTARLLARSEGKLLGTDHIKAVLRVK